MFLTGFPVRSRQQSFRRNIHTALVVDFHDLDIDQVSDFQDIFDFLHAVVGNIGDVQQTVGVAEQIHEGAEALDPHNFAFVDFADFASRTISAIRSFALSMAA